MRSCSSSLRHMQRCDGEDARAVTIEVAFVSNRHDHPIPKEKTMFEKKATFKKFAFTFLGGVLAGAVLGLLYAPVTGKKLQKKVADVSDQVQQTVRKIANA